MTPPPKETYDRVKNNLQGPARLQKLQAEQIVDAARRDVLRDTQKRVRPIALLHEPFYPSQDLALSIPQGTRVALASRFAT